MGKKQTKTGLSVSDDWNTDKLSMKDAEDLPPGMPSTNPIRPSAAGEASLPKAPSQRTERLCCAHGR